MDDTTIIEFIAAGLTLAVGVFFIARKMTTVEKDLQFLKDEVKELKRRLFHD